VRVTLLGTANAFFGAGRAHSCALVEDAAGAFLVDCGASALQAIRRPESIEAICITHLHGDHFAGVAFFLLASREELGRRAPLRMIGPSRMRARVRALISALYADSDLDEWPFPLEFTEVERGGRVEFGGRRLTALEAHHMREHQTALCYRIETEGRVLAFTGDTGARGPLTELADGSDLFVCECTFAATSEPDAKHLSVDDIARLRPSWTARCVVLTHLSAEARAIASSIPGVIVGEDGMTIDL
jgi:ribonuclease BN (tRNA processing enzyme)